VLFATLGSAPGSAAVLRVPLDYATVGDALAAASVGDEVRVADAASPYAEQIDLPDGVILSGGWNDPYYGSSNPSSRPTILELPADSTGSVVGIGAVGAGTELRGFTIRGGDTFAGGGIFCGDGSAALIRDCIIRDNHAAIGGGALVATGSSVRFEDCRFVANTAIGRGGGVNVAAGSDDVAIVHCTFEACSSAVNAQSNIGGGGVATSSGIRFERNTLRDNWSGSHGGGLWVADADIRAWGNLFYDNVADAFDGGGIYHLGGSGTHDGTLVEGCTAGRDGGGVHFEGGSNRFLDGFLHFNRAANGFGGGVHFREPVSGAAVRGTEITGNHALAGGGVAVSGILRASLVDIVSNTIVANEATGSDGTDPYGGGIHVRGGLVSDPTGGILNNIIALQTAGSAIYCDGILASPLIRFSCVFNDDAVNTAPEFAGLCTDRCGISGNICVDPRLCCGPACDPPGPPALALELRDNSPCLGAGEGGVDMGAHPASVTCANPVSVEASSWGAIKSRYR
jgi:hypothetical protein